MAEHQRLNNQANTIVVESFGSKIRCVKGPIILVREEELTLSKGEEKGSKMVKLSSKCRFRPLCRALFSSFDRVC